LTITATLLRGVPMVTVDSAGQRIMQTRHDGLFRFQRGATHRKGAREDDFALQSVTTDNGGVLDALALAARTTASYPVAFEPSYIPANDDQAKAFAGQLHPNMSAYLGGAWETKAGPHARYAVDGGVLANTPTRPALAAIDAMPAEGLVRRVLLLVHPHAPAPTQDSHDGPDEPPTLTSVGGSILGALTSEGSRNYAHLIEQHNRVAGGRRDMRAVVVRLRPQPDEAPTPVPAEQTSAAQQPAEISEAPLTVQARLSYPWYQLLRTRRVARDLAQWWVDRPGAPGTESVTDTYQHVLKQLQDNPAWIPAATQDGDRLPPPHHLGYEGALGVADAAVDYLRRAIWQASTPGARAENPGAQQGDVETICKARWEVSEQRNTLICQRADFTKTAQESAAAATNLRAWVNEVLTDYTSPPRRRGIEHALADIAKWVAQVKVTPPPAGTSVDGDILGGFTAALAAGHANRGEVLTRLNQVQVLTYVVSDELTTGNSLPIDLVQLTYQFRHPFAATHSGEEKVAGDTLSRFSAFLKRSWRVNDWAWGRLDASATLCRLVLEPSRVQRYIDSQRGPATPEPHPAAPQRHTPPGQLESFADAAERLVTTLIGPVEQLPGLPTKDQVIREVKALDPDRKRATGSDSSDSAVPGVLTHLPRVFAALLACEVAADEMPELIRAVEQDEMEGANPRARGSVAVKANKDILTKAGTHDRATGWAALDAFASAGIGTETPGSEGSSDQMITTATTAAGAGITLLNSPRAGLSFLSPVMRTVRGAALLPYWTITGLATTGTLARGLAIIAMAAGATLLALGLLGIGPGWGVAVGAAVVLGGFAYGALRTGTVLHGTVLLIPSLVLLAWAAQVSAPDQAGDVSDQTAAGAARPFGILLAVVLLIGGLLLLGSLRPPMRSPLGLIAGSHKPTDTHTFTRRAVGLVLLALGALALLAAVFTPAARDALASGVDAIRDWFAGLPPVVHTILLVLLVVLVFTWIARGGRLAYRTGLGWRMVVLEVSPAPQQDSKAANRSTQADQPADAPPTPLEWRRWTERPVEHPAGTAVGWSWVYGMVTIGVGLLMLAWFGFTWPDDPWARAALIGLAAAGLVLTLPVPWWLSRNASRRLHIQLVNAFAPLPRAASPQAKAQALFDASLNYRQLLTTPTDTLRRGEVWNDVGLTKITNSAWTKAHQPTNDDAQADT
jgi:patatin-related protein